jgi:hypothetical protein
VHFVLIGQAEGRDPRGLDGANDLVRYFRGNEGRLIHKWVHYFDIYDRHLARFRGKEVVVLEFGVSHGGSLEMWRDYFGPMARIYGVDIDPRCKAVEGDRISVLIGDQGDRGFLRSLHDQVGTIDVVIDDGGHTMSQQIATFEVMYPGIATDGVFLVEDLHTSYWEEFGGAYLRPGTFIEYAKGLLDQLNAWHSRDSALVVDGFTRTTRSVHWYDSVIVFEKGTVEQPRSDFTGSASF